MQSDVVLFQQQLLDSPNRCVPPSESGEHESRELFLICFKIGTVFKNMNATKY